MDLILAITGASGVIYGVRTLELLLKEEIDIHLIISESGKEVLLHEMGDKDIYKLIKKDKKEITNLHIHDNRDFFTPPASGSFIHQGMLIAPCSMSSLGYIASGIGDRLIHRAADVCLKERRPLIMVPRESPLSSIHLENMLKLSRAGATILPACPSFYNKAESREDLIDSVIARILNHLGLKQELVAQWQRN